MLFLLSVCYLPGCVRSGAFFRTARAGTSLRDDRRGSFSRPGLLNDQLCRALFQRVERIVMDVASGLSSASAASCLARDSSPALFAEITAEIFSAVTRISAPDSHSILMRSPSKIRYIFPLRISRGEIPFTQFLLNP